MKAASVYRGQDHRTLSISTNWGPTRATIAELLYFSEIKSCDHHMTAPHFYINCNLLVLASITQHLCYKTISQENAGALL